MTDCAIPVIPKYDSGERKMVLQRTGFAGQTPIKKHWEKHAGEGVYISIGFLSSGGMQALAEHIIGDDRLAASEGETLVPRP